MCKKPTEAIIYPKVLGDSMTEYDIITYTDGACKGNPGIGGWGVILVSLDDSKEFFGAEAKTTNNRMELMAAIRAIKESCKVQASSILIYTDSQYVQKGITEWIKSWKKNGLKNSTGKPVKNIELWKQLDELCGKCNVSWQWVRGHNDNPGNERADILANKGINQLRRI
jgi:ribonuclease HI